MATAPIALVVEITPGHYALAGWGLVAASVLAYDAWALRRDKETLSRAFWRGARTPRVRVLIYASWLGITWHLLVGSERQILPERYRVFYRRYHPVWVAHARLIRGRPAITIPGGA